MIQSNEAEQAFPDSELTDGMAYGLIEPHVTDMTSPLDMASKPDNAGSGLATLGGDHRGKITFDE